MKRLSDFSNAMILMDKDVRFYWSDGGMRWVFNDVEFIRKREHIGLHTHVVEFHMPFIIDDRVPPGNILHNPIIKFHNLSDLIHFRLLL